MIILKILLWVILAVLLLLAAAMLIPLRVTVKYTDSIELVLKFLFIKIPLVPREEKSKNKEKSKIRKKKKTLNKTEATSKKRENGSQTEGSTEKATEEKTDGDDEKGSKISQLKDLYKQHGLSGLINIFRELARLAGDTLKPLFKRVRLNRLDLDVCVAKDNAADTAVHFGYVCSAVYPALSVLLNVIQFEDYSVNIKPDFDKKESEIMLDAEISVMTCFAVYALIYALIRFIILKIKGIL